MTKFLGLLHADAASEAGTPPDPELFARMGPFIEEVTKAGVLLASDGLQPTSKGKRVKLEGGKMSVIDGPFTESKELIASYALFDTKDMDEAVAWLKKCPNPHMEECEVEIRPVFEMDDFGEAFTPELRAQEERLMAEAKKNAGG